MQITQAKPNFSQGLHMLVTCLELPAQRQKFDFHLNGTELQPNTTYSTFTLSELNMWQVLAVYLVVVVFEVPY